MNELFTIKIAMCANKINIVNLDFTRTINLKNDAFLLAFRQLFQNERQHFVIIFFFCLWGCRGLMAVVLKLGAAAPWGATRWH